ncbi:MAG TPA: diguanylate cyclase [Firmicutes bacterium]|nr:diguanylate cyclase [Bacillota bacterium]
MAQQMTQITGPNKGLPKGPPRCRGKRRGICTRSDLFCLGLSLILYAIPAWKEQGGFNFGLFEDAIWYVYFLPAVLLAYYYGFKGSILNVLVSAAVVYTVEAKKHELMTAHKHAGSDDLMLMVGLTALASLSVGFMAERLKQKERELAAAYEAVIRNSLTGLYNHGYFQERLPFEIEHAKADSSHLSLLFIDVDNFKGINDACGHLEGDRALILLSEIMKANLRENDILARYGGDEFVVILPGADKEIAYAIGKRLIDAVRSAPFPHHKLTVSIGVATFPEDADDPSGLIRAADKALRKAKEQGKNSVVIYPGDISIRPVPLRDGAGP